MLRHHKVHIHRAWILDSGFDRRFSDLVKYDPFGRYRVKAKHFAQMPANCFSLTVFVCCEPYFVRLFRQRLQFVNNFPFFFGNYIAGFKIIFDVDTHAGLLQIANMAKAAIHLKILSKDLFNGLCFCRALNY